VLVLDNLGGHKTREVRGPLDRSGFAYRHLPPYSPDLDPIEPAWAPAPGAVVTVNLTFHERATSGAA
jgi:DDE superfamily endonuclease